MADVTRPGIIMAVFASDRGPGDPERASLMSQAGSLFARRGASLVCLAEEGTVPVPLITAARTAGGRVRVVGDADTALPSALAGVELERFASSEERLARMAELANVLVALPGSLRSATALFGTWSAAQAAQRTLPMLMLNRNKAYEVVRGFAADVLSHAVSGYDKSLQFSDTIDDLWNKANRLANR